MHRRRANTTNPVSLFSFQDIITTVTGIMLLVVFAMILNLDDALAIVKDDPSDAMRQELAKINRELAAAKCQRQAGQTRLSGLGKLDLDRLDADIAKMKKELAELKEMGLKLYQKRKRTKAEVESAAKKCAAATGTADQLGAKVDLQAKANKEMREEITKLEAKIKEAEARKIVGVKVVPGKDGKRPVVVMCSGKGLTALLNVGATAKAPTKVEFATLTEFCNWLAGRDYESEYLTFFLKPSGIGLYKELELKFSDPNFTDDLDYKRSSYQGVGVWSKVSVGHVPVVVDKIFPNTPAFRCEELKLGSRVVKVAQGDGAFVAVEGMDAAEVLGLIRGPKGTKVRLVMELPDGKIKEFSLMRDVVEVEGATKRKQQRWGQAKLKIERGYEPMAEDEELVFR